MTKESIPITKKSLHLIYSLSIFRGLSAGILMMIYLETINIMNLQDQLWTKFPAFIILGLAITDGIRSFKKKFRPQKRISIFKHNLVMGFIISIFSGLAMVIMNTLGFMANSELGISLIEKGVSSFSQLMVVNGGLFFLCLATGMIMTLMSLQYFKEEIKP